MKKLGVILGGIFMSISLFSMIGCGDSEPVNKDQPTEQTVTPSYGAMVNIDLDFMGYIYNANGKSVPNAKDAIDRYFEAYNDGNVSDFIINIFCQQSITPSNVITSRADKYFEKKENGIPVDYTTNDHVKAAYLFYKEFYDESTLNPFDPVGRLIENCRENQITPWLSFRMNDVHYLSFGTNGEMDYKTHCIRSNLIYEAEKNGGVFDDKNLFCSRFLDYNCEYVRNIMLEYIEEQVYQYDTDGIELDFTRDFLVFDYRKEFDKISIFNDFMRSVRKILDEREKDIGHEMKLMVRVPSSMNHCETLGFDVKTWAKENIVDVFVLSGHFMATESYMPIDEWIQEFKGTGAKVSAGLEKNLEMESHNKVTYENTLETYKGFISQYYNLGSDKIYLYNCFNTAKDGQSFRDNTIYDEVYALCKDESLCHQGKRRHVVIGQETRVKLTNYHPYSPFPIEVYKGKDCDFEMILGKIKPTDTVYLKVGSLLYEEDFDISATLNGNQMDFTGITTDIAEYSPSFQCNYCEFELTGIEVNDARVMLKIACDDFIEFNYIEVAVESN